MVQTAISISKNLLKKHKIHFENTNTQEIITDWNYYKSKDNKIIGIRLKIKLSEKDDLRIKFIREEAELNSEISKTTKFIDSSFYNQIVKDFKSDYYDFLENI